MTGPADEAYLVHHWRCPHCISAGQGRGARCAQGADLWAAYLAEVGFDPAEPEGAVNG